ncbi:MAG: hypothetical protein JNM00_04815 [Flavobacteriales bacterium]|nr:hypothetical protein [Flavobacteriales bacterium]
MKPSHLTAVALLFAAAIYAPTLRAQGGGLDNAVGVRLGIPAGITFQHYFSDDEAAEFILASRYRGWTFTALYEWHKPAFQVDGLKWFVGVGGHIGTYHWYAGHPWWDEEYNGSRMVLGVDGIIGLEYFIPDTPLMVSVDWKPDFNLIGYNALVADNGALSVRYRF